MPDGKSFLHGENIVRILVENRSTMVETIFFSI